MVLAHIFQARIAKAVVLFVWFGRGRVGGGQTPACVIVKRRDASHDGRGGRLDSMFDVCFCCSLCNKIISTNLHL